MQQLETELSSSMQRAIELETQLSAAGDDLGHIPKMKSMIQQFTEESKEMLKGLTHLERENERLIAQLQNGEQAGSAKQFEEMQQELLTLQAQYAELEERYLELRMQG